MTRLQPFLQLINARRIRFVIGALLSAILGTALVGCEGGSSTVERPKVGQPPQTQRELLNSNFARAQKRLLNPNITGGEKALLALSESEQKQLFELRTQALKAVAPGAVVNGDPPICLPPRHSRRDWD
jgi:hypothetical protein